MIAMIFPTSRLECVSWLSWVEGNIEGKFDLEGIRKIDLEAVSRFSFTINERDNTLSLSVAIDLREADFGGLAVAEVGFWACSQAPRGCDTFLTDLIISNLSTALIRSSLVFGLHCLSLSKKAVSNPSPSKRKGNTAFNSPVVPIIPGGLGDRRRRKDE
ncbi:uncharacterized protein PAC_04821 [Phialocephala subalpina]|uniref:Uncharacterized protein n=1 Tax=Phialocephala subalpina TaxID=576137 RepID=A0A1L7WQA1_9HELO|nr:uncharacterized protein PAC_04821 [Phialocephala subalpina]